MNTVGAKGYESSKEKSFWAQRAGPLTRRGWTTFGTILALFVGIAYGIDSCMHNVPEPIPSYSSNINVETPIGYSILSQNQKKHIDTIAEKHDIESLPCIDDFVLALDAGHGNGDPGASASLNGVIYHEADIVKTIVEMAGALLESKGVDVRYVRPNEMTNTPRSDRLELAKGSDAYVSVHANAFNNSVVHGVRTYYPDNSPSSLHFDLEKTAVEVLQETFPGRNIDNIVRNELLDWRVLDGNSPSAMFEIGFLTNMEDLNQMVNQPETYAFIIAKAVLENAERRMSQ